MRFVVMLWGALGACEEEPENNEPVEPIGECGTPTFGIELTFQGVVRAPNGTTVADAEVLLEDRQLRPATILGTAMSNADGSFTLDATDISSWPDCWLTLLDYRIVGAKDIYEGELQVNRFMWESIQDDRDLVDLRDRPLVLDAP